MRMYDKSKRVQEKRIGQLVIKKTGVSVSLNALLQQVKDGGIVAIFRSHQSGGKIEDR